MLDFERGAASRRGGRFILYVEGPRDRAILRAWAYRLLPAEARRLFRASVILGGRRPARAVEHFRGALDQEPRVCGLCVLDRDDGAPVPPALEAPGLEFFTWTRRHIESYLLVPAAIRRALRIADDDSRVRRILEDVIPAAQGESAYRDVDAKRLLGRNGPLPLALGRDIPLDGVAQATRHDELHPDVHALFARLRQRLGVAEHPETALRS